MSSYQLSSIYVQFKIQAMKFKIICEKLISCDYLRFSNELWTVHINEKVKASTLESLDAHIALIKPHKRPQAE